MPERLLADQKRLCARQLLGDVIAEVRHDSIGLSDFPASR